MAPRSARHPRSIALFAVAAALAIAACSDSGSDAEDLLVSVDVSEGPHSVLSAVLDVETSEPATVTVKAVSGDHETAVPSAGDPSTEHTIPVVGLRGARTYSLEVRAESAGGDVEEETAEFQTGDLPDGLPPLDVTVADKAGISAGITLFNATEWGSPAEVAELFEPARPGVDPPDPAAEEAGVLLGIDEEGEVVWYYRTTHVIGDVSQTERGTILVQIADSVMREIDVLGNTVREWGSRVATEFAKTDYFGRPLAGDDTQAVGIDSMHHEIDQLPNGNLITLSTKLVRLSDADARRLCPDSPDPDVVEDVAVEFTPGGDVVNEWPLTRYFDPVRRPGSDMCVAGPPVAPPNWFYPSANGTRDWSHGNAVVVDERTNELQLSMRHLDSVVALRYQDDANGPAGELLWELSPDGNLDLAPGGEHSFHQHAVEPQDDGSILLYDNGNTRPGTVPAGGTAPPYSRAVVYRIDREALTAKQVWEHRDVSPEGAPVFTAFLGDADRVPNGDVLITHGAATTPTGVLYARIVEVHPGVDGKADKVVFDVTVGDRTEVGWTVYRADRVASLYPGAAAGGAG